MNSSNLESETAHQFNFDIKNTYQNTYQNPYQNRSPVIQCILLNIFIL